MSENRDPELPLQSSESGAEDGDRGRENALSSLELETAAVASSENNSVGQFSEESNGFSMPDSNQNNGVSGDAENSGQNGAYDTVVVEDAGKEDTFVDCPDELIGIADSREAVPAAEIMSSDMEGNDVQEMQYEDENVSLMQEAEQLRATLKKKEYVMHEFEEERKAFVKELHGLHRQLQNVTHKQSSHNVNDSQVAEMDDVEDADEKTLITSITLKDLVIECSQLVNTTANERLQYEATMGELLAKLSMKDQEIEYLNAKVVEFSVSDEVHCAYVTSVENSMKVSSDKERDFEVVLGRVLDSINSVVNQQDPFDDSTSEKIVHVERGISLLIDNYNKILLETNQLQECLFGSESGMVSLDFGTIFASARNELTELKAKQAINVEKLYNLEDENKRLIDQLDNYRMTVENVNAELENSKRELEQEKVRCSNTKDKLTMAVTKGKALVQQRDALKQSLAEKSSELEKYSVELQEKSNALEAAELFKVDLANSENLVASLQENLLQRNLAIKGFEDILSQLELPHVIQSMDSMEKLKWLVDEKKVLEAISLEFHELRDTIYFTDLPDIVSSYDLKSSVSLLKESIFQAKDEIMILQDELAKTKEAAHGKIDHISGLLSIELQEKNYLQEELDDLKSKYHEVTVKVHQASLEKDQIVKILQEESGIETDDGGVYKTSLDFNLLFNRCFQKLKMQAAASVDIPDEYIEAFEKVQCHLYVSHQDLILYEMILEEEFSKMSNCSTTLIATSQELAEVKEENSSLQKDLEKSEEKYAILREKLSLAVKKGKGLVQDRENMKNLLDERKLEIENLRQQLHSLESTLSNCKFQINSLTTDIERIPVLESDLGNMKDKCSQFEQFLVESNNMLHRVIESIDSITLPTDIVFEEPIAKVEWLAEYMRECNKAKMLVEQELENVKEEASTMASKLGAALATMKSLEDALSSAEKNVFQLSEEKKETESNKIHIEQELQKALDEAYSQSSQCAEALLSRNLLEESLALAENKILVLVEEKEEAQICITNAEMESKKVKEELAIQIDELAEAHKTIESLEKSLAELETNVVLLKEQNNDTQTEITKLVAEQKILQEEASAHVSRLDDAFETIKSLEDALVKADNRTSILEGERKNSENEILALKSRLNACMEELVGTNGNLQSRSVEFTGCLNDLRKFIADETLLNVVAGCFEKKFESLKQIDIILRNTMDCFVNYGLIDSHDHLAIKDSYVVNSRTHGDVPFAVEKDDSEVFSADYVDNISSSIRKAMEEFWLRNNKFTDYFKGFSSSMDQFIADLIRNVEATSEEVVAVCRHVESLKETVKNLEMYKHEQENTTAMLENDVSTLLSACLDTTNELQFEVTNHLLSIPELENMNSIIPLENSETSGGSVSEYQVKSASSKYTKEVEKLSSASLKVRSVVKQFESTSKVAAAVLHDMQNRLETLEVTSEKLRVERDSNQNIIGNLETDLKLLQSSFLEIRHQLEVCQGNEEKLKEREAELSLLYNNSLVKEQEAEYFLSAAQMEDLFERIRRLEISFPESEILDPELYDSPDVKKLFYLIDYVSELQNQLNLLSHDKQKLQSTVTSQILTIENLKEKVDRESGDTLDLEEMKKDLSELSYALEQILSLLGYSHDSGDKTLDGSKGLVKILEKHVMNMLSEYENSKSKIEELSKKLTGSQKTVEELTTKNKLLEEALQGQTSQPEINERNLFEAPSFPSGSEISEIEDVGLVGKNVIPSVPSSSAAHARTLRKGSTDHLAINMETESDRLIGNAVEIDEEKGHVFKALNTSGLIPRQGKLIADRIDGIWVSGGRVLMSRPDARLGLITYWLLVHIWLLGTIL